MNINDLIPYIAAGAGLLIGYHILTANKEAPPLSAAGNTIDYPNFPGVGIEPHHEIPGSESQIAWPHPYNHPIIPRYVGAPAYFQQTIPLDETHYTDNEWQGQQIPPLYTTVSQNMPTNETYSHHHFYFDTAAEPSPLDNGILTNTV